MDMLDMRIGQELELKVLVNKEQFEKLLSFYSQASFVKQINNYYACQDSNHYTFRIREKEGKKLFTLKEHQDNKLMEFEKYITSSIEEDKEIMQILKERNEFPPFKLLGTLTTNRALINTGYAELCFDINDYNGIRDYEIEYEVIKEHDYITEFKKILAQANIDYSGNTISKYKRFVQSMNKTSTSN